MTEDEISAVRKILVEQRAKLIESLGMFVIKMLLTLNAGAIVVLMTLLGSLAKGEGAVSANIAQLKVSGAFFLGGIAAVFAILAIVYVAAQLRLRRQLAGSDVPSSWRAWLYLSAMVLFPLISLCCFGTGFLAAAGALS